MTEMLDMSRFTEAKSDQLNADDLIGVSKTLTVTRVTGAEGDQPISIFYQGDNGKPFKPCKTMRRVLLAIWGRYANDYVGRSMTVYRDDKVTFGGLDVGGIRISHMSHIDKKTVVVVAKSKGKKAGIEISPLAQEQVGQVQSKPRQTAEEWAADHLGFVTGAADIARLDAVEASGTKAMAKLATSNADLHASVVAAYAARRAELTDDDEPFAEGRAPTDHGDQHTDDDAPGIADQLIERVNAAKLIADVLAIETEYQSVGRDMLEVADQDRVEAAIDAAKVAMKGAGK